jgi:hypothetical protein
MTQAETNTDIPTVSTQVIPISQIENDPIEYASSMTSAYQQDELDDGKFFKSIFLEY